MAGVTPASTFINYLSSLSDIPSCYVIPVADIMLVCYVYKKIVTN